MTVKECIVKAKNGDKNAFNYLVEHYEEIFCDNVVKYNGNDESLRKEAKKELPDLIRKYLNSDCKSAIDQYLRYRALYNFKEKEKISDTRTKNRDYLIDIYSKRFLKHILKYKNILTEEELEKYSINYITNLVNMYIDDRDSFSNNINSRIAFETKYVQDTEVFLIRYIVEVSSNDRIVDYFYNKYLYILEEYKTKSSYSMLKDSFREIIENVLNNITTYVSSIETHIRKGINKKQAEIKEYLKEEVKKVRYDEQSKILIYHSYYSVIEFIYEKYKDKIDMPEEEIKEILKEKYDLYFNGYINGTATSDLRKHLINSFNNFFNWELYHTVKKKIRFVDSDAVKTKDGAEDGNKRINKKS